MEISGLGFVIIIISLVFDDVLIVVNPVIQNVMLFSFLERYNRSSTVFFARIEVVATREIYDGLLFL